MSLEWKDGKWVNPDARFPDVYVQFMNTGDDPFWFCFLDIIQRLRYEGAMPDVIVEAQADFLPLLSRPFYRKEFREIASKWVTIVGV